MKKSRVFCAVIAMAIFLTAISASALTFNPFKRAGRVKANNLIISGNFVYSRLLADLAQYYSKQPVLLISPDVDGSHQIYYLPSGTKATPVNADEFQGIVEYVNPKKVIVLGGEDFVPRKFVDLARAKYSVIIIDSDDWNRNAATLGDLLKADKLAVQFKEYRKNLEAVNK